MELTILVIVAFNLAALVFPVRLMLAYVVPTSAADEWSTNILNSSCGMDKRFVIDKLLCLTFMAKFYITQLFHQP